MISVCVKAQRVPSLSSTHGHIPDRPATHKQTQAVTRTSLSLASGEATDACPESRREVLLGSCGRFHETGPIRPANIAGYGRLPYPDQCQNRRNCPTAKHNFPDVVRSPKAEALRTAYSKVVAVDDLTKGDFTDALRGVSALIHVVSPLPGSR